MIFVSGLVTLIAIDAWQDHTLPDGTSFDIVFDRLEPAIYSAVAAGLIAAVAMVFLQAGRFSWSSVLGYPMPQRDLSSSPLRRPTSSISVGLIVSADALVILPAVQLLLHDRG